MSHKVFVILLLLSFQTNYFYAKHLKMNLQRALDSKLVKATATSLGGYQGYCVKVELKNLSPDSLEVIFEAGRRLNSLKEEFQDILVVKEQLIVLGRREEKCFEVKGYCCQASNRSPASNLKYEVKQMADTGLVRLANYLSANNFNRDAEQHAIWAISDKKSTAGITSTNDSTLLPLRQLVSNLKGEKLPWYTIISSTYVYNNGVIETNALWLRGKIKYTNDKADYITLQVYDKKGKNVCLIRYEWKDAGNNEDYQLNIPLKGLAKGKYTIELSKVGKELAKQEFEI